MLKRLNINPVDITRNHSPLVHRTEVKADSDPSRTATVYCRAIFVAEMDLGCAAFPIAVFGTATDPW